MRASIGVSIAAACLTLQACSWSSAPDEGLPDSERVALLDLFAATNGDHWTRRDWWQTPGKECSWVGVICARSGRQMRVVGLHLADNNLRGTLPDSLARLTHLAQLWLSGNTLSGPLPEELLTKIDRAELHVGGYAEQLSSVRELSVRHRHTEFVCNEQEYRVRADRATRISRERCNVENHNGPTWWQYRTSYTGSDVERLFRLVETGGFDALSARYSDHQLHTEFATLTVKYRDNTERTVSDSGGVAPTAFFALRQAIENVVHASLPEDEFWAAGPSAPDFDAVPPGAQWAFANITRADPSDFGDLAGPIRAYLERRRCRIPHSSSATFPSNVIRGRFTAADQTDTAVLCSSGGVSSILIFRGDDASDVAEIASRPDEAFILGMHGRGPRAAFWRTLAVASRPAILRNHAAHGGPSPPPLDHDGIDDGASREGYRPSSVVWYLYQGRWLKLQGTQ